IRRAASEQLAGRSLTQEEQDQINNFNVFEGGLEIVNPDSRLEPGSPISSPVTARLYQMSVERGLYDESSSILNYDKIRPGIDRRDYFNEIKAAGTGYVEKVTRLWFDALSETNESKSNYLREKYDRVKAIPENERSEGDERFLRDTENDALYAQASGASFKLNRIAEKISSLNAIAVTDEQKAELDGLYEEYDKLDNSLKGIDKSLKINEMQYSYVRRVDAAEEEWKQDRYEKLAQGDGKLAQFFSSFTGAVTRAGLSLAQVPKVWGDLIGDNDYDAWDEFYESIEGTKRGVSAFYNDLPQGKSSSDLPFASRLALVGGNAVGSAATFIGAAYLTGGASTVGQTAAVFGTAFLTSEADYYQEALDAGMDTQSAALFGSYLATQSAALECIIPEAKFLKTAAFRRSVRNSVMNRVKSLKAGESFKDAMKFGFKDALNTFAESGAAYGKVGFKEAFFEELPTTFAEDVAKSAANASGQKKYFNDTFNPEAYADAILGSFVAGPGMNLLSRPQAKSPVQEETIREIAERKDKILERGTASDKKASPESKKAIENVANLLSAMKSHSSWNGLSREEQNHALAIAQQAEVIKAEQAEMAKVGVEDETKQLELDKIKNELNDIFSVQRGREKDVAKENKIKQIEEEFNRSVEGEDFNAAQRDERDNEIIELQKERKKAGVNDVIDFLSDMKPMVPFAVERIEQGQPVAESVRKASSDYLYKKYKQLVDMKSNPNRMMTMQQIETMQNQLEQDIRTLEGTAGETQEINDQENIQRVPSQVGVGQKPIAAKPVEVTSEEATPAGGVLQAQEEEVIAPQATEEAAPVAEEAEPEPQVDNKSVFRILEKSFYEGNDKRYSNITDEQAKKISPDTRKYLLDLYDRIAPFNSQYQRLGKILDPQTSREIVTEDQKIKYVTSNYFGGKGRPSSQLGSPLDPKHKDLVFPVPSAKVIEDFNNILGAKISDAEAAALQVPKTQAAPKVQEQAAPKAATQVQEQVTTEAAPKTKEKPTRKTRLAKLFETSEGEEAVPLIEQSLSESGIKVDVKDDADYNNDDRIKRSQGRGSEGMFVADDGTIILNRDKIKGEWGKTIVFHEGIHPVVNIIRNTDP
ncbi:MAG: hypothetical protein ACK5DE_12275, partial [Bacteroidota bacterium]